jgi:hypothetical protein
MATDNLVISFPRKVFDIAAGFDGLRNYPTRRLWFATE